MSDERHHLRRGTPADLPRRRGVRQAGTRRRQRLGLCGRPWRRAGEHGLQPDPRTGEVRRRGGPGPGPRRRIRGGAGQAPAAAAGRHRRLQRRHRRPTACPRTRRRQQAARHKAVQDGLIVAANVPLEICRVALEVCRLAVTAAEIGNPAAVTDAGIGAILGEAAVQGASLNVEINMGSIDDVDYVRRVGAELQRGHRRVRQAALRGHRDHCRRTSWPKRKDGHGRIDH